MKKFSHIYAEKEVLPNPITQNILKKFPKSKVVLIDRYSEVFNRPNQNYLIQKERQNLILAKKRYDFIYKGSKLCEDFGNINFYHTSIIFNCVYDCDYCYLQGMYPSGHLVIFVNIEDYFKEVDKLTQEHKVYLSISYETDLLTLEYLTGFTKQWIEYAKGNKNLVIEIRTKSANFYSVEFIDIPSNVIFAWTLLPQPVIDKYEKLTPSLSKRIESIKRAISKGLKVRISIEPVMYIEGFEKIYKGFVEYVFSKIPKEGIQDVNIGAFRMVKEQAKKIEKLKEYSPIFCYDTVLKDGIFTYKEAEYFEEFVYREVIKYIEKEKVYVLNKLPSN
ncbi:MULTISPECIES: SPL family radical SAM protein [Thermoanaerobacter]|uniref:DNA repair photolyase-like protein n=2 Tax=Thermoanaerobacter TaxID=1754 RepID=B0KB14_THEP3|nr:MULTISPECIES: deoxyribodipyrimidine photo-lyase [Thermoanaerobacter]ABY93785.1 DNA repair photolyase-like protein [Thermoanaerobacter pseudethanolicus ATCC 33223]ADV78749.1 DNA repair photolyase-like protein [Thermoanaerobacter brockii subsp. finnii Ako-1]HBW60744.1 DNA repair photolyase [Thermoanaerobacter sp.]